MFQSNTNDLLTVVWFQVFLSNTNNYMASSYFLLFNNSHLLVQLYGFPSITLFFITLFMLSVCLSVCLSIFYNSLSFFNSFTLIFTFSISLFSFLFLSSSFILSFFLSFFLSYFSTGEIFIERVMYQNNPQNWIHNSKQYETLLLINLSNE